VARQTPEERAAAAAQRAEEERADRERAERELDAINAFEQEHGRPPTKDELAERRAARASAQADRELEVEMGGEPGGEQPASGGGNGGSGSIAERAQEPGAGAPAGEDEEGQTFLFAGEEVTLATLLKRVKKIEVAWKFSGRREKGKGALPALDGDIYLMIRAKPGKYGVVPTRDDQEKAESAVIEVGVEPKVIHDALSDDGRAMMADLLRRAGWSVEAPATPAQVAG
jgi:hypothetical protein